MRRSGNREGSTQDAGEITCMGAWANGSMGERAVKRQLFFCGFRIVAKAADFNTENTEYTEYTEKCQYHGEIAVPLKAVD